MSGFLKYAALVVLGYVGHLFIETFILANVLSFFGLRIPILT